MNINKQKESETNSKEGAGLPSAVDDAADVMSKYPTKKRISNHEKHSFPPIEYEKSHPTTKFLYQKRGLNDPFYTYERLCLKHQIIIHHFIPS